MRDSTPLKKIRRGDTDRKIPENVDVGENYNVNVTAENTGDPPLEEITVRIGDQTRKIRLYLTEKRRIGFDLTAPQQEKNYEIKAEAYTSTIYEEDRREVKVEHTHPHTKI